MSLCSPFMVAALCAASLMLMPAVASAKVENGQYQGKTVNGSNIGFTVKTDPGDSSRQIITSYTWTFKDSCRGGGTLSGGWYNQFQNNYGVPVTDGKTKLIAGNGFFYVDMGIVFASDGTATGKINNVDQTLTPADGSAKPKKSLYCFTKRMAFTASMTAVTLVSPMPQGAMPIGNFVFEQ